jgi:hypothetical protein
MGSFNFHYQICYRDQQSELRDGIPWPPIHSGRVEAESLIQAKVEAERVIRTGYLAWLNRKSREYWLSFLHVSAAANALQ